MADDATLFRSRAEIERSNADAATLDNVRDRADRASRAWEAMAVRAEKMQATRADARRVRDEVETAAE